MGDSLATRDRVDGGGKTVLSLWTACGSLLAEALMRTSLDFDLLTVLD